MKQAGTFYKTRGLWVPASRQQHLRHRQGFHAVQSPQWPQSWPWLPGEHYAPFHLCHWRTAPFPLGQCLSCPWLYSLYGWPASFQARVRAKMTLPPSVLSAKCLPPASLQFPLPPNKAPCVQLHQSPPAAFPCTLGERHQSSSSRRTKHNAWYRPWDDFLDQKPVPSKPKHKGTFSPHRMSTCRLTLPAETAPTGQGLFARHCYSLEASQMYTKGETGWQ